MRAGSRFAGGLVALLALAMPALAAFAQSPQIQVYDLPPGARPTDAAPAPGGMIWYTSQARGALGILDPATAKVREVSLGKGAKPNGVVAGPDGAAWITDAGHNGILRFDPQTEEVKVWRLPQEAGYAAMSTAAFDRKGVLWFTGQTGIYGRLDPATGKLDWWHAPKGKGPSGIAATPDGSIYYASVSGNHIARIDTTTGAATVIEPPKPGQGARRVWPDSKGNIWVSEWNSGRLSRYQPATGRWDDWRLPGSDPRAYAVYVDERDIVWVSDFGGNAVHTFDPATETFTTFAKTEPGADVRQILGRPGEVWLPEYGADKIIVVRMTVKAGG